MTTADRAKGRGDGLRSIRGASGRVLSDDSEHMRQVIWLMVKRIALDACRQ